MTVVVYGIANCDTVKKGRAWLAQRRMDHLFHDYKKQGVPPARLDAWIEAVGWEALVNRRGTTWRKLDAATQAGVVDAASARKLMLANASVIRRPVIERDGRILAVGFDAKAMAALVAGVQR
jgi:Spx/MgsR family transcriptional regulator